MAEGNRFARYAQREEESGGEDQPRRNNRFSRYADSGRNIGDVEDFGRSLAGAIPRGFAALAGLPGDIERAYYQGTDFLARNADRLLGRSEEEVQANQRYWDNFRRGLPNQGGVFASGQQLNESIVDPVFGEQYEPQTTAGEYGRTIGNYAPAAAFPGSWPTRLARMVVPGTTEETAGQVFEGTPYEAPARVVAGGGGGLVTELGIAARASAATRQAARNASRPEAEALEREFGPMTAGERSGNQAARRREYRMRLGMGSEDAERIVRGFDAERAPAIRENAMRMVTRGQEPLSQNLDEAGVILGDELRSARQAIRERGQSEYDRAFELAKGETIRPGLNDTPTARVQSVADEFGFDVPAPAQTAIRNLERQIQEGTATQANVERARQALNRARGTAINARDDATEFVYDAIIGALDDWQAGLVRNPEARRAMLEARGIHREMQQLYGQRGRTELSTGQTGRMDPGGRAIDRTVNTDLTGEQIIDSILGAGSRPSQQALGAVRRIKELGTERIIYTNRGAESGVRVPGRRRVGGQTAGARRFAADSPDAPRGMEQPTPELQALREGLAHRLLRDLDDYVRRSQDAGANSSGVLPVGRLISQFDNALNRSGRQIMEQLFTARELEAMQRFLRFLRAIEPPAGAHAPSAPAIYSMISDGFGKLANVIPVFGPALKEFAGDVYSTNAARAAIRPPSARPTRQRKPVTDLPNDTLPPLDAVLALPPSDEPRRLGEGL